MFVFSLLVPVIGMVGMIDIIGLCLMSADAFRCLLMSSDVCRVGTRKHRTPPQVPDYLSPGGRIPDIASPGTATFRHSARRRCQAEACWTQPIAFRLKKWEPRLPFFAVSHCSCSPVPAIDAWPVLSWQSPGDAPRRDHLPGAGFAGWSTVTPAGNPGTRRPHHASVWPGR